MNAVWYGDEPVPLWLRALTPAYRLGQRLDRWWGLRHRPPDLEAACIIVVGNLSVGGSGKTPLVIWICDALRKAGLQAGVISRGYGRNDGSLVSVQAASDPAQVGDEPLLIAQRARVPVIVSADRCAAARELLRQGVQVVISDDGLQHYALPRSIEICVIDGSRGLGNGRQLPAGPLREPAQRLRTVDHIVINGDLQVPLCGLGDEELRASQMTLLPGRLQSLQDSQTWRLSQFAGCRVNAIAGIGNPDRFFALLRAARIKVIEHVFADHHAYRDSDFAGMEPGLPILMTQKDAVKCERLGLENAWFLSIDAVLPAQWETDLLSQVRHCLDTSEADE